MIYLTTLLSPWRLAPPAEGDDKVVDSKAICNGCRMRSQVFELVRRIEDFNSSLHLSLIDKYFCRNRAAITMRCLGWLLLCCPERQKSRDTTAPPPAELRIQYQHEPRGDQCSFDGHWTPRWSASYGARQLSYGQFCRVQRNGHKYTAITQYMLTKLSMAVNVFWKGL